MYNFYVIKIIPNEIVIKVTRHKFITLNIYTTLEIK